jgi:hypothetical protein
MNKNTKSNNHMEKKSRNMNIDIENCIYKKYNTLRNLAKEVMGICLLR